MREGTRDNNKKEVTNRDLIFDYILLSIRVESSL